MIGLVGLHTAPKRRVLTVSGLGRWKTRPAASSRGPKKSDDRPMTTFTRPAGQFAGMDLSGEAGWDRVRATLRRALAALLCPWRGQVSWAADEPIARAGGPQS